MLSVNDAEQEMTLYLASGSPRRRELLAQVGLQASPCPVEVDESVQADEAPLEYVKRLSLDKARQACRQHALANNWVLGADTAVVLGEQIMGKPECKPGFVQMMQRLSGCQHEVMSGVCLRLPDGEVKTGTSPYQLAYSVTKVRFRSLTSEDIENYWNSGEPLDKAGGYGIQGLGAIFVESMSGSYSGVVGLPLFETVQLLTENGFPLWYRSQM